MTFPWTRILCFEILSHKVCSVLYEIPELGNLSKLITYQVVRRRDSLQSETCNRFDVRLVIRD